MLSQLHGCFAPIFQCFFIHLFLFSFFFGFSPAGCAAASFFLPILEMDAFFSLLCSIFPRDFFVVLEDPIALCPHLTELLLSLLRLPFWSSILFANTLRSLDELPIDHLHPRWCRSLQTRSDLLYSHSTLVLCRHERATNSKKENVIFVHVQIQKEKLITNFSSSN